MAAVALFSSTTSGGGDVVEGPWTTMPVQTWAGRGFSIPVPGGSFVEGVDL